MMGSPHRDVVIADERFIDDRAERFDRSGESDIPGFYWDDKVLTRCSNSELLSYSPECIALCSNCFHLKMRSNFSPSMDFENTDKTSITADSLFMVFWN